MIVEQPENLHTNSLKEALNRLMRNNVVQRRNICIADVSKMGLAFCLNASNLQLGKLQQINPRQYFFIGKCSPLIKDKTAQLLTLQEQGQGQENIGKDIAEISTLKFKENMISIVNNLASSELDCMLLGEARAYLVLWIFFEFFIVFGEDIDHLLTIRNYFYKYVFETDLENFELFRRRNLEEYAEDIRISTQLRKIKFLIRICDFQEMQNYLENLQRILEDEDESRDSYPGVNKDFAEIFNLLSFICLNYNEVLTEEPGVNGESKRAEIYKNIQRASNNIEEILITIMEYLLNTSLHPTDLGNINELIDEVQLIRRIFTGDIASITKICENYKEWILMSIYYRFHQNNFILSTKEYLKNCYDSETMIDKDLISILIYSPFEFYQNMKNKIPKWFQFHIMEVLFDLEYLPGADSSTDELLGGVSLRNYDYVEFLDHLMILEIGVEDFINYSSLYDYTEKTGSFLTFLEKIVIMNVMKEFEKLEKNNLKKSELKNYLKDVLNLLFNMRETNFLINSVTKICFDRFFERGLYKNAVEFYYSYSFRSASLQAREDVFEKIFYEILLQDDLSISNDIKKISKLKLETNNQKFEFIKRLINLTQIMDDQERQRFSYDLLIQIKDFFNFCFVEENCPKSMWLWTLNLFRVKHKENIENFREIKYDDYKKAYGNHYSNGVRIKYEMRKFFQSNRGSRKFRNQTEEQYAGLVSKEIYALNQFLYDCQIYTYSK